MKVKQADADDEACSRIFEALVLRHQFYPGIHDFVSFELPSSSRNQQLSSKISFTYIIETTSSFTLPLYRSLCMTDFSLW